MGIVERKERQKSEMRAGILTAAWQLVMDSGWQSLSIRKIADSIEYSVPVVYEYFENKEAILLEFTRLGYALLAEKLKLAKAAHPDPAAQLEAMAYAYWDFAFGNKEYYQVMFGLGMPNCEQAKTMPELSEFSREIESSIQQIAENTHQEINTFLKVRSFWSMIHGLVSINMVAPESGQGGIHRDELNNMVLKDFITGFIKGLQN